MSPATCDQTSEFADHITRAAAAHQPLVVCGGRSKEFIGGVATGDSLDTTLHQGLVIYEPEELTLSALAGTSIAQIAELLARSGQMLAFNPPQFSNRSTLGGCIAAGLSGPERPFWGSARDAVLGVGLINGSGQILKFGGRVMKNVAGYDISRLMAGSWGTLGLITEVTLRVVPLPEHRETFTTAIDEAAALNALARWIRSGVPISAACHLNNTLHVQLSGSENSVKHARLHLEGDWAPQEHLFWNHVRDHTHPFFDSLENLWRCIVPPHTPPLPLEGNQLIDWAGAQRWYRGNTPAELVQSTAKKAGGYALLFRSRGVRPPLYSEISGPLLHLHQRLKAVFDPASIFNREKLFTHS